MNKKILSGDYLSRSQETSAQCSPCFRQFKLYKMRLLNMQPTLFGDYSYSDKYELLAKAMRDDLYKEKEFKFRHPKDIEKEYVRHYISSPLNGNAFLAVGQFKKDMDFAFVRILLHSAFYGEPYLVLERYAQSFRNPDILAKMVESAFNYVLKGSGVEMKLEPWESEENIMWLLDYEVSYMNEMQKMKKEDLVMIGYEEALERHLKQEAKKKKRQIKKSQNIKDYILHKNKNSVLKLLRRIVRKSSSPKKVAMPFRLLIDRMIMKRAPFKLVLSEIPELEGRISDTRYNHWTDDRTSSYQGDSDYEELNKELDNLIKAENRV